MKDEYLFLGTVVAPLLGVPTLNKYPSIPPEKPIPIIVFIFSQGLCAYKPFVYLSLEIFSLWDKQCQKKITLNT